MTRQTQPTDTNKHRLAERLGSRMRPAAATE